MARNQDKEITHIVYRAIEYIKKIDKINKKISEAKGKIGIYCAGVHTEKLYELTSLKNKWNDVVVIIDKEYKGELLKKQVIAPEQIKNYYLDMIIISSYKYQNEVKKYLLQNIDFKGSIIELYDDSFDSEFYEV